MDQVLETLAAIPGNDQEAQPSASACLKVMLHMAGLRATPQRMRLGQLLFGAGHRHFSAEQLFVEAKKGGSKVSLATVYNTLGQFQQVGLLRAIAVDGKTAYFDTNTSNHYHFFIEAEGRMEDIPAGSVEIARLPPLPEGMDLLTVDVVVRIRHA
jgi:Fur family iron response transcriptional regulator